MIDEPADDEPTMRGTGLTKSFGDGSGRSQALRGVTVELNRGEFALLMGPSGSGKSTLLAILSGLQPPDAGEVVVRDRGVERSLWRMSSREREEYRLRQCGFIFQGYNLFPALTARQQLEIVLKWGYGTPHAEARKRSDEMLSLLGLGRKGNQLPNQLSGGEKQRVAIGRALIKNPRYCFADEPTSALDWAHGEQVVELLRAAAHERGATILVVSHDARMVPYVDVSYHMEDGVLSREGAGPGHQPAPRPAVLRSVS